MVRNVAARGVLAATLLFLALLLLLHPTGASVCLVTAAQNHPLDPRSVQQQASITHQKQQHEQERQFLRETSNTLFFDSLQQALDECPVDPDSHTLTIQLDHRTTLQHRSAEALQFRRGPSAIYHLLSDSVSERATLVDVRRWTVLENDTSHSIVLERLSLDGEGTEAALFQPDLQYTTVVLRDCVLQNYNGPHVLKMDARDEGVTLEVAHTTFRNVLGSAVDARHLEQYLVYHSAFEQCGGVRSPQCVFVSQGFGARATSEFYRNEHLSGAAASPADALAGACAFHIDNAQWDTPAPAILDNSVSESVAGKQLPVGMRFTRILSRRMYEPGPGEHFTNHLPLQHMALQQLDVRGATSAFEWLPGIGNADADVACALQQDAQCTVYDQTAIDETLVTPCVVRDVQELRSALATCPSKVIVLQAANIYAVEALQFYRSNVVLVSYDRAVVFGAGHVVEAHTSNVLIRGVTFVQPPDAHDPVLTVREGSDVSLYNNRFVGSGLSTAGAVRVEANADGVRAYYNSFEEFYFRSVEATQPNAVHLQQNSFSDTIGTALRVEKVPAGATVAIRDNTFYNCRGVTNSGGSTYVVSVSGAERDSATIAAFQRNVLTMDQAYTAMNDVAFAFKAVTLQALESNVCYGASVGFVFQNVSFASQTAPLEANGMVRGLVTSVAFLDQDAGQQQQQQQQEACVVDQNYTPLEEDMWHYANVSTALRYCPSSDFPIHVRAADGSGVHRYSTSIDVWDERHLVGERGVSLRVSSVVLHNDARFSVSNLELRADASAARIHTARDSQSSYVSFENVTFSSDWVVNVRVRKHHGSVFRMVGSAMRGENGHGHVHVHFHDDPATDSDSDSDSDSDNVVFVDNTFSNIGGTPIRVDDVDQWEVTGNVFTDCSAALESGSTGVVHLKASERPGRHGRRFVFERNTAVQNRPLEQRYFGGLFVHSMVSAFWLAGPFQAVQQWSFRDNSVSGAYRFPVGVRFTGQAQSVLEKSLASGWVAVSGSSTLSNVAAQGNCGVHGSEHDMLWTRGQYLLDAFIGQSDYDTCSETPGTLGVDISSCKCAAAAPEHCVVDARDPTFVAGKNPYYGRWLFKTMREALEHCIDPNHAIEVRSVGRSTLDGASLSLAHDNWYVYTRNAVRIHEGGEHVIGANNITLSGFVFPPYTTIRNALSHERLENIVVQNCVFEAVSGQSSIGGSWGSIAVHNCTFHSRQRLTQEEEFAVVHVRVSGSVRVEACAFDAFDRTALRIDGAPRHECVVSHNRFSQTDASRTAWKAPRGGVYVSASNDAASTLVVSHNRFTGASCPENATVGEIVDGIGDTGLYAAYWIESPPSSALIAHNSASGVPVGMRITHALTMEGKTAAEQQSFLSSIAAGSSNLNVSGAWHDIVAAMPNDDQLLQAVPFQYRGYICDMGCTTAETIFLVSIVAFVVVLAVTVCCILGCGSQEHEIKYYYSEFLHARMPVDRMWWPVLLRGYLPWLDPKLGPRPVPAYMYDNVVRRTALARESAISARERARHLSAVNRELWKGECRYGSKAIEIPPSLLERRQDSAIRVLGAGRAVCPKDIDV